jgi:glycosyltransferase involved in cell wall biosynthesis
MSKEGHRLSVIIPAYNEENGICSILDRVLSIRPALGEIGLDGPEVLVVDDGSRDGTAACVAAYTSVRLVRHNTNHGYGAALKTGFCEASGDLLSFLDADGTYPPEYLPALCKEALNGAELVIGSRMAGADSQMPTVRRLGNAIFASLVSLVGNQHVGDSASGMRVFHRDILERVYPLPDGLNFTPVMTTRAVHEGIKMVEVPIAYSERVGRSKLNVVRDGVRFLNSILWTAMSYNPVRILGLLGLAGVAFAGLISLALVLMRLGGVTNIGPWGVFAVYLALVLGVAGVSVFSLGAMFNYLLALVHKRPIRQGLFGKPIFNPSLDSQFWWMGGLAIAAGIAVGAVSLVLSFGGWEMARLWLWLLGSAMLILMGVQLAISWVVMQVLAEVSQREVRVGNDLAAESKIARDQAAP